MISIFEAFDRMKEWTSPREALHSDGKCPFLLSCNVAIVPAPDHEIDQVNGGPDLSSFWCQSESADLFKDEDYGQWGLRIFSPSEAVMISESERKERPGNIFETDIIIGRFYGDSDQLLVDASAAEDGIFPIVVGLSIDDRSDWPIVAASFSEFLERYISAQGEKFWEHWPSR